MTPTLPLFEISISPAPRCATVVLNPPFGGGADDRGATPPEIASPVATVEPEPDPVDENGALIGVGGGGPARLGIGLDEGGASVSVLNSIA